jgi:hypothetical protein
MRAARATSSIGVGEGLDCSDPDPIIPSPYPYSRGLLLFFVLLKRSLSPAKRKVPELVSNCPVLVMLMPAVTGSIDLTIRSLEIGTINSVPNYSSFDFFDSKFNHSS